MVFFWFFLSGNIAFGETRSFEDILHPLGQDSVLLEGEDGKITRSVRLPISNSTGDIYRFQFKSDGVMITGFAAIPRSALEGEQLPVLVYGRGGEADSQRASIHEKALEKVLLPLAVKNNYVLLAPEVRGAQGSGGKDEWGGREMNDISAMVKLAQSLPYVQKDNIFFLGVSRGGTRAYLLAASDVPFKGIIAIAGVSDFFAHFPSNDKKRISIPKQFGLGLEESFIKMSAVRWPEKIRKPLLMIHSVGDTDVPIAQSRNLAKALEKASAPFKFVEMKGTRHNVLFGGMEEFEKIAFPWLESLMK